MLMSRRALLGASLAAPFVATRALAQAFPSRPIQMIVVFPAGGSSDIVARMIADRMSQSLPQRIVIENVPGAGGNIGSARAARSPADGYTILNGQSSVFAINPHLFDNMGFDPLKDLVPVTQTVTGSSVLVVNAKLGVRSLQELIAQAKTSPGKLQYASFGNGSLAHINGEMFRRAADIDIAHVPYRGAAPALNDVIAGHVPMMFDVIATVLPHIQSGALLPLAVTGPARIAALPDTPSLAESYKGYDGSGWQGFFVPNGTPPDIVALLHRTAAEALADKAVRERLIGLYLEPIGGTPGQLASIVSADHGRWGKLIREAGIRT